MNPIKLLGESLKVRIILFITINKIVGHFYEMPTESNHCENVEKCENEEDNKEGSDREECEYDK